MPVVPKPLAFLIAATLVVPPASPAGERRRGRRLGHRRLDGALCRRGGGAPYNEQEVGNRAAVEPGRPPPGLPLRARRDGETGPPPRPPRRRGGEGGRGPGGRLRAPLEPRRDAARPPRARRRSRGDDAVGGGG